MPLDRRDLSSQGFGCPWGPWNQSPWMLRENYYVALCRKKLLAPISSTTFLFLSSEHGRSPRSEAYSMHSLLIVRSTLPLPWEESVGLYWINKQGNAFLPGNMTSRSTTGHVAHLLKMQVPDWMWCCTSVIPATQDIGRTTVQDQHGHKVHKTLSQSTS
jgi:hypothetical protein